MKKLLCAILALLMLFSLAACETENEGEQAVTMENIKIGMICLHDENSTYDNNFIQALKQVQQKLGLRDDQVKIKVNIAESEDCYNAAVELADEGCNIIFADSFGHEQFMIQAAEKYPDIQFCHATGTYAQIEKLENYHNAFASIYEGRFLAGVAAGMKLNQMIDEGKITAEQAVIGYVGAFDYAEVVSGMTSFFLGARYMCKSATMKVTYTNSWFDIALEREAALSLIEDGCVLISQHADSEGAPKACEEKQIPNVAYNISTISMAPTTALISSKIDWAPYFDMIIDKVIKGEAIPTDYCGTMKEGSVKLTELNTAVAAPGTQEKITELQNKLLNGELNVFDTSTFTVDGKTLTEYMADVQSDSAFTPDTQVIKDGEFCESTERSAPYFDIKYIDGITKK